jgi:hypothetical protein
MKKILILCCSLFVLTACENRLSDLELKSQVQKSMEETWRADDSEVKIDSLTLSRESEDSDKYTGILETAVEGGNLRYSVDVSYDGKSFEWKVTQLRMDASALTESIKVSMRENFDASIKINSLYLIRESDSSNKYMGILETSEPGSDFKYDVIVNYDGTSFMWETTPQD